MSQPFTIHQAFNLDSREGWSAERFHVCIVLAQQKDTKAASIWRIIQAIDYSTLAYDYILKNTIPHSIDIYISAGYILMITDKFCQVWPPVSVFAERVKDWHLPLGTHKRRSSLASFRQQSSQPTHDNKETHQENNQPTNYRTNRLSNQVTNYLTNQPTS